MAGMMWGVVSALIWLTSGTCYPQDVCDIYERDVAGIGQASWIHIVWRGAQTRPQPLIWISHARPRLPSFPEQNVVLSRAEYRSMMALPVRPEATGREKTAFDNPVLAFRVTRRVGYDRPSTTYLSAREGCRYLATMLHDRDVVWTAERKSPFEGYEQVCSLSGASLR